MSSHLVSVESKLDQDEAVPLDEEAKQQQVTTTNNI
jgi:hypothetical protein